MKHTPKKTASKKPMTEEQKRIARNEYSRKWKAEHAKQVKEWNQAWYERKLKAKSKVKKSPLQKNGRKHVKKGNVTVLPPKKAPQFAPAKKAA